MAHIPTIDDVIERSRLFRGRDVARSLLSGGHVNAAYVVQVGETRYVVRHSNPSIVLWHQRGREEGGDA